jgi:hypothetical protein
MEHNISRLVNHSTLKDYFIVDNPKCPTLGRKGKPHYTPQLARQALANGYEITCPCRILSGAEELSNTCPHELS